MSIGDTRELLIWYVLPCALMTGVSIAYFLGSSDKSLARRLLTSAGGAVGTLLYVAALAISRNGPRPDLAPLLGVLYLVPIGLFVISITSYRGRREFLYFELLNIPTIAFTAFIGLVLLAVGRAI